MSNTFTFEEIFPDYSTFKAYTDSFMDSYDESFNRYAYGILARYFNHQAIRYSEIDAFKSVFANVYIDKFEKFRKKKELCEAMFNLTVDEITTLQQAIANTANNPNDEVEDPTAPLRYISSQTYSKLNSNKLRSLIDALNSIPTLKVDEFIKGSKYDKNEIQFSDLFTQIIPINYYAYENAKEE